MGRRRRTRGGWREAGDWSPPRNYGAPKATAWAPTTPTGKTLEQLARDYVQAHARFKRTAEAYRQAAAGGPAGPDELHEQMEWLQSRMALIKEAVEAAGGGVDDEWRDEGSCRIYGQHCEVLATS